MTSILVVDDEPMLLSLLMDVFEESGFRATGARTASEAVAIIQDPTAPTDVIVTDIRLPDGTGWYVGEVARQRRPSVPVFYVSGYPDDIPSHVSADRFISKPYRIADILARIGAALAVKEAAS